MPGPFLWVAGSTSNKVPSPHLHRGFPNHLVVYFSFATSAGLATTASAAASVQSNSLHRQMTTKPPPHHHPPPSSSEDLYHRKAKKKKRRKRKKVTTATTAPVTAFICQSPAEQEGNTDNKPSNKRTERERRASLAGTAHEQQ